LQTITETESKTGQIMAVDKYNVGEEVLELFKSGMNYCQISDALAQKGVKIGNASIGIWIKKNLENYGKQSGIQEFKKIETMIMDYEQEIGNILTEVKDIKARIVSEGDKKDLEIYVKLVSKLYQGIELLAKLRGDVKPNGSTDIKIIVNEINKSTYVDNKGLRHKLFDKDDIIEAEVEIVGEN